MIEAIFAVIGLVMLASGAAMICAGPLLERKMTRRGPTSKS